MFGLDKHKARILIVDDHPIVREGLRARISSQSDMEVCGEAADVGEALAFVKDDQPDLVIVDISLGDGNGLDLIQRMKVLHPSIVILVLSAHDESLYAERALRAGAKGYIGKSQAQGSLLIAMRMVLESGSYLSPTLNQRLIGRALGRRAPGAPSMVSDLSNRELQVFQLIGRGRDTKAIAAELHLSPHTIDRHRENIKAKLKLKRAQELQIVAAQWALTSEGG